MPKNFLKSGQGNLRVGIQEYKFYIIKECAQNKARNLFKFKLKRKLVSKFQEYF